MMVIYYDGGDDDDDDDADDDDDDDDDDDYVDGKIIICGTVVAHRAKSMSDSPPRNHQERFATSSRRIWILQTLNAVNCWIWWAVRFPRWLPPDVSAWHGLDDLGVQSTEKNHQSTRQALVNYTFSVFYTVYIKIMVIFVIQTCWQ